jgi:hypothetical protein
VSPVIPFSSCKSSGNTGKMKLDMAEGNQRNRWRTFAFTV